MYVCIYTFCKYYGSSNVHIISFFPCNSIYMSSEGLGCSVCPCGRGAHFSAPSAFLLNRYCCFFPCSRYWDRFLICLIHYSMMCMYTYWITGTHHKSMHAFRRYREQQVVFFIHYFLGFFLIDDNVVSTVARAHKNAWVPHSHVDVGAFKMSNVCIYLCILYVCCYSVFGVEVVTKPLSWDWRRPRMCSHELAMGSSLVCHMVWQHNSR